MLRGTAIASDAYMRKELPSLINNLSFHSKKIEKEQNKPKSIRKKKVIKR